VTDSEQVRLALVIREVEQLRAKTDEMSSQLTDLKSKALLVTGGAMLLVILASIAGWAVSVLGQFKVLPK